MRKILVISLILVGAAAVASFAARTSSGCSYGACLGPCVTPSGCNAGCVCISQSGQVGQCYSVE